MTVERVTNRINNSSNVQKWWASDDDVIHVHEYNGREGSRVSDEQRRVGVAIKEVVTEKKIHEADDTKHAETALDSIKLCQACIHAWERKDQQTPGVAS